MFLRKKKEEKVVKKESRLKLNRNEEITEGEIVEKEWDIKKIGIGLFILVLLFIAGTYVIFPKGSDFQSPETLGAQTVNLSPTPPLPNKEDVQGVINNAQETLSKVSAENLTASQAAIQQVINDLQTLQGKNGAVHLLCNTLCRDQ